MTERKDSQRFEALDGVRATAMLLGVFFHALLFGGMVGGGMVGGGPRSGFGPPGAAGGLNGSMMMQDWLHSFRMPLFFLISGFFCRMMFKKYGLWTYLVRRWWRIGLPLIIGLFTFVPMYQLVSESFRGGPGMGGPPMIGSPNGGPPNNGLPMGGFPFNFDDLPPPPPGFVPPPLIPFDKNQDGSIDAEEWQAVRKSMAGGAPPEGSPIGGPDDTAKRDLEDSDKDTNTKKNSGEIAAGSSNSPPLPGRMPFGAGGMPPMPPGGPGGMFGPPGDVSTWLFGPFVRLFTLSHLWFLWYLMVFATATPFFAMIVDSILLRTAPTSIDRFTVAAIRWQVMPLLLGLISLPALLLTKSFFGWSLGFASGIGRGFPDFLWHLEIDMPFYFTYFLIGWLLHRMRDELPAVAAGWWINLAIGMLIYGVANHLSRTYAMQTSLPNYGVVRLIGYTFYAVGAAYLAWGFLGAFQRFADRPTLVGGYLADTALWVYLVHQALLFPFLAWLVPFKLTWWVNGTLATGMTIAAALLLFESVVRPTPLMSLFGPARSRQPGPNIAENRRNPTAPAAVVIGPLHQLEPSFSDTQS